MTTTANLRKQNPGWLVWLLLFILFVFALMLFGCTDKESEPMTARFFCLSDEPCAVWYGVYDTDMRRENTDECWHH